MSPKRAAGFSIVEMMVVVTTIGILALMGLPGIRQTRETAQATVIANDMRVFIDALEFYSTSTGSYPSIMNYSNMPDDLKEFIPQVWKDGSYIWSYGKNQIATYLWIYQLNLTAEQSLRIDSIIDNGNVGTGKVIVAFNGAGVVYLFEYTPPFDTGIL